MRYNLEKLYKDIETYMYNMYIIRLKETLEMEDEQNKECKGTSYQLTRIDITVLTNGYSVCPIYTPYKESQYTYIQSLDELKDLY